jgi:hypothetical protein
MAGGDVAELELTRTTAVVLRTEYFPQRDTSTAHSCAGLRFFGSHGYPIDGFTSAPVLGLSPVTWSVTWPGRWLAGCHGLTSHSR